MVILNMESSIQSVIQNSNSEQNVKISPCNFDQQCQIKVSTRRFCSYCRLKKCFNVGMNKSHILDERTKLKRRQKSSESKSKKFNEIFPDSEDFACCDTNNNMHDSTLQMSTVLLDDPMQITPNGMKSDIGDALSQENSNSLNGAYLDNNFMVNNQEGGIPTQKLFYSDDNNNPCEFARANSSSSIVYKAPLTKISNHESVTQSTAVSLPVTCEQTSVRNSLNGAHPKTNSLSYHAHHHHQDSLDESNSMDNSYVLEENGQQIYLDKGLGEQGLARPLTQYQIDTIRNLQEAYEKSFYVNVDLDKPPDRSNPTLSNLVNASGFIVRKLIHFAKKLADFTILDQECQICLLKGGVLSTLFLRSACHYDPSKDAWLTPTGEVPTKILKIVTGKDHLYDQHLKYCKDFRLLIREDGNLVSLMQVLCLFSSDRSTAANKQMVWSIHDRYVLLLKHYLECRFGFSKSRLLFASLLTNLADLQRLIDEHGHMLLRVDPSKVDPLILEVFNLSSTCSAAPK